jgi:hypothetical protein
LGVWGFDFFVLISLIRGVVGKECTKGDPAGLPGWPVQRTIEAGKLATTLQSFVLDFFLLLVTSSMYITLIM